MRLYFEKLTGRIRAIIPSIEEKDRKKFERYGFLSLSGEEIDKMLESDNGLTLKLIKISALSALVLSLIYFILSGKSGVPEGEIKRPEYGSPAYSQQYELNISYGGEKYSEKVDIDIAAKEMSGEEELEKIEECRAWLTTAILGENKSLNFAGSRLNLPNASLDGLVEISWDSSDSSRLTSRGEINALGLSEKGEEIILYAALRCGKTSKQYAFSVKIDPRAVDSYKESLSLELEDIIESVKEDSSDLIVLPQSSGHGAEIEWAYPKRSFPLSVILIAALGIIALYTLRHESSLRRLKKKYSAFENELPSLSLQLILLLNAGLVCSSAFEEIIDKNRKSDNPLYRALENVKARADFTNTPFVNELYVFAHETGMRDFIRFATLVMDCAGKGSELADKLEKERVQMWGSRLNRAKAKAKEADTKLCLPLMLLLGVLVIITISPTMLEM